LTFLFQAGALSKGPRGEAVRALKRKCGGSDKKDGRGTGSKVVGADGGLKKGRIFPTGKAMKQAKESQPGVRCNSSPALEGGGIVIGKGKRQLSAD